MSDTLRDDFASFLNILMLGIPDILARAGCAIVRSREEPVTGHPAVERV
jgi:hypothetical protein